MSQNITRKITVERMTLVTKRVRPNPNTDTVLPEMPPTLRRHSIGLLNELMEMFPDKVIEFARKKCG
jgi:hypothetical protein